MLFHNSCLAKPEPVVEPPCCHPEQYDIACAPRHRIDATISQVIELPNHLSYDTQNYKISVGVKLASVRLVENIEEMVNKMVPANMQREVWVMYNRWSRFKNVKWSTLKSYTWGDILSGSHWQE